MSQFKEKVLTRFRLLLISSLSATLLPGAGCDRKSSAKTQDPEAVAMEAWRARMDQLRREYEANQARLLVDWRKALSEVASNELNADRLSREVRGLTQTVTDATAKVDAWDEIVRQELARREKAVEKR